MEFETFFKIIRIMLKKLMMNINVESKYDFNKTYFFNEMISIPTIVKCRFCKDGKIKRESDGKREKCPICNGAGNKDSGSGSIEEQPRKCFLHKINLTIKKDENLEKYIFKNENNKQISEIVYKTIEECIENQSKGIMGYTH